MAQATESEQLTLTVHGRTGLGKNKSYRLRVDNLVPGVVYGPKMKAPVAITVNPKEVRAAYMKAGRTGLVTLQAAEGAPTELTGTKILFKEIQSHPYKNILTHVDLHQLDLSRKVRVTVPLSFVGKARGLAEGGIMNIVSRQVEIKCLPQDIPNHIDVDVSDLGVNDSIHVTELAKKLESEKIEFIYENEFALVAVVPPEEEKATAADPAAEAAAAAAAGAAPGAPAAAGASGAAAPAAAAGAKAPAKK